MSNSENGRETVQAKIRNKLQPYWTLADLILELDSLPDDKKQVIMSMIKEEAKRLKETRHIILALVDATK